MISNLEWQARKAEHEAIFDTGSRSTSSAAHPQHERKIEELKETPLFSGSVLAKVLEFQPPRDSEFSNDILGQYGLLAKVIHQSPASRNPEAVPKSVDAPDEVLDTESPDSRLFANVNTPWSAFICGSQGSGKSNTLSCLLEAGLLRRKNLGVLNQPLTALVFHYDQFSSTESQSICEAAYLASHEGLQVNIFVSPENLTTMKKAYHNKLKVAEKRRPNVVPLYFQDTQLSVSRMRKLMSVGEGGRPILYLEMISRVLRAMSMKDQKMKGVNYKEFLRRLSLERFNDAQSDGIGHRLSLLEAFLKTDEVASSQIKGTNNNKNSSSAREISNKMRDQIQDDLDVKKASYELGNLSFEKGTLNIVDLSSQHIDPGDACMLFNIVLEVFLQEIGHTGSVIALDEAHKYMTGSGDSNIFTESLLSVVRQQRHLATRVLIATQEPTISPALLDLCSMTIVHRFTSPRWMEVLKDHLAGARRKGGDKDELSEKIFESIVDLEKGEALLFSPSATLESHPTAAVGDFKIKNLGPDHVKILVRPKLTVDGGKSINVTDMPLRHSVS